MLRLYLFNVKDTPPRDIQIAGAAVACIDAVTLASSAETRGNAFPVSQAKVFTVFDDLAIDQMDAIVVLVHNVLLSVERIRLQIRNVKMVGRDVK